MGKKLVTFLEVWYLESWRQEYSGEMAQGQYSRAVVRENDSCVCGVCKGSCRVGLAPHLEMQGCERGGTVTGSIGVKTGKAAFAVC